LPFFQENCAREKITQNLSLKDGTIKYNTKYGEIQANPSILA
jgi:hypothetical protein